MADVVAMPETPETRRPLRVAVEGCGHGKLHDIYAAVQASAEARGWNSVDLLIIGGDFQAVRNSNDLTCMAVSNKYREIGDFHEYYSGARVAPILTIFVGGNHEASNHMFELYYGGWVAPNIYYMGAANLVRYGPLRILGMSGIWKGYDYHRPHYERIPYDGDTLRSAYHIREVDVRKLLQIRTQVDIGISHDWPRGIEWAGDYDHLFRIKEHLMEDSETGKLGNVAAKQVLDRLRPAHWFSAHLHCKYTATLHHQEYQPPQVLIRFNESEQSFVKPPVPSPSVLAEKANTVSDHPKDVSEPKLGPIQEVAQDETAKKNAWRDFHQVAASTEQDEQEIFMREVAKYHKQVEVGDITSGSDITYQLKWKKVGVDDGTGREVQDVITTSIDKEGKKAAESSEVVQVKNTDEINLDMDDGSEDDEPKANIPAGAEIEPCEKVANEKAPEPEPERSEAKRAATNDAKNVDSVPDDIRSQLPASFAKPSPVTSGPKPIVESTLPAEITNTTTEFLALDKCEGRRHFLHLTEVKPVSKDDGVGNTGPYQLMYDKEWLAITRALHPGFTVGDKAASVPSNKGDVGYKPDIIAAEEWIEENVVKAGKMVIPYNFTITAPVYDPSVPVSTQEQPPEYQNPQTEEFCKLIGIENAFAMSDEQRQSQNEALKAANESNKGGIFRLGGHGGRGGRGNRGGRGRGRGRSGHGGRGGHTRSHH
ncbi:TPA_exp: putative RNA lariat debranching enzyme [Trichophyton benhamiae CBS 112371]|uniref:RNA lariat debranching enzyme, putative n=1 Tax=Arthroderma benhamiae (strain ATCC MYA-4681 / CBS 112371) TaxID=663331 RepID=D4B2P6_ARTBC|nr:RNA lariat debranching enzyme, putative [Trichophyton benhamiae CBS 112371]EFE30357.1 RNA lariat debranching enzyme, putative [Trichophyton benhamiae CBS 112371]DAA73568.1 TPA_exp: putative RNA lariat debranching enzyme [Trichophyton benhamiae CBS 112371]